MLRTTMVIDTATEIPVMIVIPGMAEYFNKEVFKRAGYSIDPTSPTVIVTDLIGPTTRHDPYGWDSWTMKAFHLMLGEMSIDDIMNIPDRVDVRAKRESLIS